MKRQCIDCGRLYRGTCVCAPARHRAAYGREYRMRRRELIGRPCELRLPGCTGVADTADHVVPVAYGGAGGRLRPACGHCNYSRGAISTEIPA